MKASFVDLRKKSGEILRALERNERITLFYRGSPKAVMQPLQQEEKLGGAADHPAFGLWKDRQDLDDVVGHVRQLRRGRLDAL